MHTLRIQIIAVAGSLVLLGFIVDLLRKRRLREEYAILWLLGALVCCLVASWPGALENISKAMGIYYPPAAIFLVLLFSAYLMLLHFSLAFSSLVGKSKTMAQEIALLRLEVERLRAVTEAPSPVQPS